MEFAAILGVLGMFAGVDAKGDVQSAARKLADQSNYSWTSTPSMGGGERRFQAGPTTGKTEKDGCTLLSMSMGQNTTEAVIKGEKVAVKTLDGWKGLDELRGAGGGQQQGGQRQRDPAAFAARRLRNFKAPAAEALDLVEKAGELREEGGAYVGEMTEEGAKSLLSFGGRGRGGDAARGPQVSGAKGTVKFWLRDGLLVKYEYSLQGKINFGGQDRDISRTTVVEIKDVATTKVDVPEDARKKLE